MLTAERQVLYGKVEDRRGHKSLQANACDGDGIRPAQDHNRTLPPIHGVSNLIYVRNLAQSQARFEWTRETNLARGLAAVSAKNGP